MQRSKNNDTGLNVAIRVPYINHVDLLVLGPGFVPKHLQETGLSIKRALTRGVPCLGVPWTRQEKIAGYQISSVPAGDEGCAKPHRARKKQCGGTRARLGAAMAAAAANAAVTNDVAKSVHHCCFAETAPCRCATCMANNYDGIV